MESILCYIPKANVYLRTQKVVVHTEEGDEEAIVLPLKKIFKILDAYNAKRNEEARKIFNSLGLNMFGESELFKRTSPTEYFQLLYDSIPPEGK